MAMVTLKRSDGQIFEYGDIFKIVSYGLTGAGRLEVEIYTEKKAQGDGDVVTGKRVPSREIQIEALCVNKVANTLARRVANAFFNTQFTYECHLDYKGVKRWIPCELRRFELPTENIHRPQMLKVSLLCPDPYFLSESGFGKNIAQITGMDGWPFMCHPRIGRVAGVYDFSQSVIIYNYGDVPTYPIIEITARGRVVNPRIQKDGAFVKVLDAMDDGGHIVINFDNNTVRKNGENINNKVSKDSKLLSIAFELGPNLVEYHADDGENVMNVYIYYYERYTGV